MTVWIIVDDYVGKGIEDNHVDFFDVVGIYSTKNNALNALNKIINERKVNDTDFEETFKDSESSDYQDWDSWGVIGVKAVELDAELNISELRFKY